ncbi:hypothetical protein [Actinoplanes sp. URMC 104]|uniref:hypothetical protein n=1 Tax=Actinoplanes sp. URMC 104 TaxID=3423409 RepID=UPI003F1A383E
MSYGFWIFGELDRERLASALASMLALAPDQVDVGDDGEDDRNWEAPVSCTVTPLTGHLHWHLDVYLGATIARPPTEPAAAAWLAGRLRTVVAYRASTFPPSAFWLVGPDGKRTRARIYEEDSADDYGPAAVRIDVVEHPIAALPGLRVAATPEVIREHRMPTPVGDRLEDSLGPLIGTGTAAAETARKVTMVLGAWEAMVARLVAGWPPDGWYPAAYYREDLETRDDLARLAETLPEPARGVAARAVAEVDGRFAELTDDDGGRALAAATGPLPPGSSDRWWWHRIPHPLPWQDQPGA